MLPGRRDGRRIPLYFSIGWLFAELLLGIALVFLISSPGAIIPPKPTPTFVLSATPTPTRPPVPTATPHPYLSTKYVTISVTGPDMRGLINNSNPSTVAYFKNAVLQQLQSILAQGQPLAKECAGVVIPYGGEPALGGSSIDIGNAMTSILTSLGKGSDTHWAFFKLAVYHPPLILVDPVAGYGTVKMEVYVFLGSSTCQTP